MYVIVVYDVGVERVNRYLNWVQNSVIEGELTKSEYKLIERGLKNLIKKDVDSVRIYILRSDKYLDIVELRTRKADISEII